MCRTVFKFLKKKERERERERDGPRLNTKQTVFNSGRLGERGRGEGKEKDIECSSPGKNSNL